MTLKAFLFGYINVVFCEFLTTLLNFFGTLVNFFRVEKESKTLKNSLFASLFFKSFNFWEFWDKKPTVVSVWVRKTIL